MVLAVKSNATREAIAGARPRRRTHLGDVGPERRRQRGEHRGGARRRLPASSAGCSSAWSRLALNQPLSWVVGTGGLKIGPVSGVVSPEVDEIADIFGARAGRGRLGQRAAAHLGQGAAERPPGPGDGHEADQRRVCRVPARQRADSEMAEECVAVTRRPGSRWTRWGDPIQRSDGHHPEVPRVRHQAQVLDAAGPGEGRRTEIDAINGSIVREGKRLGIPTPVNEVMVARSKCRRRRTA